jgi:phosphatidylserine decarboxylase
MLVDTVATVGLVAVTALPLAWKWQLGVGRAAAVVLPLAVALSVCAGVAGLEHAGAIVAAWLLTVAAALGFVAFRFYRDPERHPPQQAADLVVSPADGGVVYVRRSHEGRLPVSSKSGRAYTLEELTKTPLEEGDSVVIGIALNFLDVHVNRAPIGGEVTLYHHHKGSFRSLRDLAAVFENERATTIIERDGLRVAVVLIASRLVRRITTCIEVGQRLACGERIGAIRFGSQVDVVLPAARVRVIAVAAGDRVVAGESVIAEVSGGAADGSARG